jgi:hypothetical protein
MCPAGYPNASTYAPFYDDSRGCSACSCGSTLTCTLSSVLLNNNSSTCTTVGHPYWMNASTTCAKAPSDYPINAVKAEGTSAGDPACAETSPSTPTGGVALNPGTLTTVCCK